MGRLWRGEQRTEEKMGLLSAWLLRNMVAVVDGPPVAELSPGAALLRRPWQPPSVLVRFGCSSLNFRAFDQEETGARARPSSRAHHTQGSARVPPAFQPGSAHRTHGGCRAYGPGSGEWRVLKPSRLRCGGRCVLRLSELGLRRSLLLSMKAVEGGRSVTVNTWQGTPSQG